MLEAHLLAAVVAITSGSDPCACLPKDVERTEIVSGEAPPKDAAGKEVPLTVERRLEQIGARCAEGKLVDAAGKAIRFFRLAGCWGNPPEDYQDILRRQQTELDGLKQRYRVIEISCNPSGAQIP